ncbi:hypothetical protein GALMADRAFT_207202 [Galerina marginata CBS 339.88]|uniref:RING-type domain-containing protein n=1 Tax=Galerina marginata (strain CBS 339.88) TaxID=685588 RepID=A0A067THI1_GALM3|nr:hypothetical protein GALMADRAFT_207202 [Galerina marginata CBS 339.88]
MGNSSSSGRGHHDESVDYGSLVPQGVYTGSRDWNQAIVSQLIVARKLAPFYRPLEDYEESWDDDQILAARKELPDPDSGDVVTRIEATATTASSYKSKRPGSLKEPAKPEAQVYRGAVECPICFLYYPPNINHSRCCDQAICTECFVQIKRAEPTATHLVSEYAACPYCVQENFGVVYNPPPWRAGLGSEGSNSLWSDSQRVSSEPTTPPTHKRRQKSFGADSPEVVTTDQIRPDWEAKLDAVRAAVARRANRRIIMRQVGDRLIPVGVTSGRVHALTPEEAAAAGAEPTGSRRSRRRQPPQNATFEQFMNMGGQDLEELMLMEAMRLSLLDHEEHQKKEAEEKKKQEAAAAANSSAGAPSSEVESTSQSQASSGPGPSEVRSPPQASGSSNLLPSSSSILRSSSPSPKHGKVDSQESLVPGRMSWSRSHSRTPPPPANPVPNIPQSEENQAAWRNRTSGPPAFSTLSAALTSASTAAAFLGPASSSEQRSSRSATPEPGSASMATTSSSSLPTQGSGTKAADISIPTITVESNTHSGTATPLASASHSVEDFASTSSPVPSHSAPHRSHETPFTNGTAQGSSPRSSITTLESETQSGSGIEISSYSHLASSPESETLREPLLSASKKKVDDTQIQKGGQSAGAAC